MTVLAPNGADRFYTEPVRYKKGLVKTKDLIPTGRVVGEGWGSRVLEYRNDPENYVVKKSIWPLENEYRIGQMLDHENIVKMKALYIKEIPLTSRAILKLMMDWKWRREKPLLDLIQDKIHGKPLYLYKMVMEKVHGKTLNCLFQKNLDPMIVESLLTEAKKTGLYLYDQKTQLQAIHGENIMICDETHRLMIIDLGHWAVNQNASDRGYRLFRGIQRLMFNIVSTSVLSSHGFENDLVQKHCQIPNLCSQDARPTAYTQAVVNSQLTDRDFENKSEEEIRAMLEEYCTGVIEKYREAIRQFEKNRPYPRV